MARNPKKSKAKKPKGKKGNRLRGGRKTGTARKQPNINVKVNVGGEPQGVYKGPDRGYYSFNPVHDFGLPKQAITPPMNAGMSITSGAVSRPMERSSQTEPEGIYEEFVDRTNPTVSLGSGISFVAGSPRQPSPFQPTPPTTPKPDDKLPEDMTRNELRDVVRSMGIPLGRKNKAELLAIVQRGGA